MTPYSALMAQTSLSPISLCDWLLWLYHCPCPFPSTDGTISSSSILLAQSLQHCIHSQSCSATDLFYQGSSQTLREWLSVAITRTLHQGEDSLLELTKQICAFLQVQAPAEDTTDSALPQATRQHFCWSFPASGGLPPRLPASCMDCSMSPG